MVGVNPVRRPTRHSVSNGKSSPFFGTLKATKRTVTAYIEATPTSAKYYVFDPWFVDLFKENTANDLGVSCHTVAVLDDSLRVYVRYAF